MTPPAIFQCEPCALLSNPANRGKKHGKTVLQQLDELQFSKPDADAEPAQSDRGLHKRWQASRDVLWQRLSAHTYLYALQ